MGRKAYQPTPEERERVKTAAGLGLRDKDISVLAKVTEATLKRHFRQELDDGRAEARSKLSQSMWQMAFTKKHPAINIFMAKTQLGWREVERPPETVAKKQITLVVDDKTRLDLTEENAAKSENSE